MPAALLVVVLLATSAEAARPLATEDAAVTDTGTCELDSYVGRSTQRDTLSANAASVQFGCGVWKGNYLGLAYARSEDGDDTPQTLVIAGKTALGHASEDSPAYALAWGSVGKKIRGTSFRYDGLYATLASSIPLSSSWTVHANLGWTYSRSTEHSTSRWSLASEHVVDHGIHLGIETFADDREHAPWVQAGFSVPLIADKLSLNASWGAQLSPSRAHLATLGMTLDF